MTVNASFKKLKVGGALFLRASGIVVNGSNLSKDLPFLITVPYLLCVFEELESK